MRLAMVAIVWMLGCGNDSAPVVDAVFSGPAQVILNKQVQGLVTSTPAGIDCGSCAEAGCGSDTVAHTQCGAEFDIGTSLSLSLTEEQIYDGVFCSPACGFVVQHSVTVTITGDEATLPPE
jgi:hypothetical protein